MDDLKKVIKQEKDPELDHLVADSIILWNSDVQGLALSYRLSRAKPFGAKLSWALVTA
jgi:hypothetical protein